MARRMTPAKRRGLGEQDGTAALAVSAAGNATRGKDNYLGREGRAARRDSSLLSSYPCPCLPLPCPPPPFPVSFLWILTSPSLPLPFHPPPLPPPPPPFSSGPKSAGGALLLPKSVGTLPWCLSLLGLPAVRPVGVRSMPRAARLAKAPRSALGPA